jgi:hypothetical protein
MTALAVYGALFATIMTIWVASWVLLLARRRRSAYPQSAAASGSPFHWEPKRMARAKTITAKLLDDANGWRDFITANGMAFVAVETDGEKVTAGIGRSGAEDQKFTEYQRRLMEPRGEPKPRAVA